MNKIPNPPKKVINAGVARSEVSIGGVVSHDVENGGIVECNR